MESYAKELPLIIKHHMDIVPYFPKYFYFYIMDNPLVFEEDMKKIEQLIGGYLAGRDISANDLIVEILEIAEDY